MSSTYKVRLIPKDVKEPVAYLEGIFTFSTEQGLYDYIDRTFPTFHMVKSSELTRNQQPVPIRDKRSESAGKDD